MFPLVVRDDVEPAVATPILEWLTPGVWDSAENLPAQLAAATVGDYPTREEAWWCVWDRIRHNGTLDQAVLPAVPVLGALSEWRGYPDRPHAIVLLREIATAERIGPTHDRAEFAGLRESLATGTRHLAARWRTEVPEVRRGLVLLLSAVPEVRGQYHELIDDTLPAQHREAWEAELVESSAARELKHWVFEG